MTFVLELSAAQRARIAERARAEHPREACGMLLGRLVPSGKALRVGRVERVTSGANVERDDGERRFELDPGHIVREAGAARAEGLEVLGFWHSHPAGPAVPSERDRARAWDGTCCVIHGRDSDGAPELRSWLREGGRLLEQELR